MLLSFNVDSDWPNAAYLGQLRRDETSLRDFFDRQKVRLCLPRPWCQSVRHSLAGSPEAQRRTFEECQIQASQEGVWYRKISSSKPARFAKSTVSRQWQSYVIVNEGVEIFREYQYRSTWIVEESPQDEFHEA